MNFFEAQDKARRNTLWMILLFVCAVGGLIVLTNIFLLGAFAYMKTGGFVLSISELQNYFEPEIFIAVAVGICLLIFGGSFYKTRSLSKGGPAVAEMLGGRLVPQSTNDLQERQLLNVVEEMSIAAGMPIPKVYLLDEYSINAFAAGQSPANAVIGVTRGTLEQLSREELQGVIAHEFSHIFNGDMRLNIRLIGVLHGILLIGTIGYLLLRSLRYAGRSRSRKGGAGIAAIVALGGGLMVIGYVGTFFGQWIKAAVSRQREYLADSSAVQFTRNKDSIAGALKKIGGTGPGSFIESPAAPEYSHAYFANGISSFWQSLFTTHPPLEKRIRAIDSSWDGKFTRSRPKVAQTSTEPSAETSGIESSRAAAKIAVETAILSAAGQAIEQIGTLNEENIEQVRALIVAMPESLRIAAQSAFSARAVIYAILIKHQSSQKLVWELLEQRADQSMPKLTAEYLDEIKNLDEKYKLPLLELCINALRELSTNQFIQFERAINAIISADKKVDLNEWVIQRLVLQQLNQHFGLHKPPKARYSNLGAVKSDAETLLSLIAYVEHRDDHHAAQAFDRGKKESGATALNIVARKDFSLESLNRSLDNLMQLKPLVKPRILKACVAIILADGKTTTRGIELVRTISICLDCPMPPMRASD
jgi:Zn-dependent protease with chaperone function